MKKFTQFIQESKDTYFDTYSAAVQHALEQVEKSGYTYDEDDSFTIIGSGTKKPSPGKTTKFTLPLYKNGKESRKALHVQVYNRETDRKPFELNFYIS